MCVKGSDRVQCARIIGLRTMRRVPRSERKLYGAVCRWVNQWSFCECSNHILVCNRVQLNPKADFVPQVRNLGAIVLRFLPRSLHRVGDGFVSDDLGIGRKPDLDLLDRSGPCQPIHHCKTSQLERSGDSGRPGGQSGFGAERKPFMLLFSPDFHDAVAVGFAVGMGVQDGEGRLIVVLERQRGTGREDKVEGLVAATDRAVGLRARGVAAVP